ncbi:BRIX domain, putative [Plasmodium gaboni]|uniref:BRIX domain, putative n=1 Tax=Plasmodium gaboni TaxID=647221 RepID=A0ABY1UM97_9APIC|nr:BRIX domain, putative [Plasmodium gaboni]
MVTKIKGKLKKGASNSKETGIRNKKNKKKNNNTKNNINENEESLIKKTNIMVIKKKGMNSEIKALSRDLVDLFNPYCAVFYIRKLKNLHELNKKLKELSYKYTVCMYIQNNKLLYSITSNYTKLSLTFSIQNYTTSTLIKSLYLKNVYCNFNKLKPLLILKNFNNTSNTEMSNYLIITQNILKNLYPSVNLNEDFMNKPRRVLLYCYNDTDQTIYFRQYATNLKKLSFKKILKEAYNEDMSGYNDVFNYLSTKLDGKHFNTDTISQMLEIGPRVSYKIFKITDQDKVIYSVTDKK